MAKAPTLESLPASLKQVKHYLRIANENEQKNPVISYYCRLYSMQKGMEIDKKSPDSRTYLVGLMDYLEKFKTEHAETEALHSEIVGQAHFEDYALKVFLYADNEDRAARFNKSVVRSFFTAGLLFDVLTVFGELSDDVQKNRKYAKWKATYIHKCLQSGEQPIAGPVGGEDDEEGSGMPGAVGFERLSQPQPGPSSQPSYPSPSSQPSYLSPSDQPSYPGPSSQPSYPDSSSLYPSNSNQGLTNSFIQPTVGAKAPPSTPQDPTQGYATSDLSSGEVWTPPPNPAGVQLNATQMQKAMKYSNYASSALRYDDSKTAIDYLKKAIKLLTTGVDSG